MKKSQPTVDKSEELTVDVRGSKYKFASQDALLQSLVESEFCRENLKKITTGRYTWFTYIKKGDGSHIAPSDIYWLAREIIARKKRQNKVSKPWPDKNAHQKVKGYLFAAKEDDPLFPDEPRGKKIEQRGFYFYDDGPFWRKTEKNWKSFRKTQYKPSGF